MQFKAPDSNRSASVGTRRFCVRLQLHWSAPQMPGGQKTANCGKHPKTPLKQEKKLLEKGLQHQKDGRMGYPIQNFSAIHNPKHWKSNSTQADHVPQRLKYNGKKIKKWEIPVDMNPYVL